LIELVNQAGNRDKQQQQRANFREAHAITPSPGHLHQEPEAFPIWLPYFTIKPWGFPFVIEC